MNEKHNQTFKLKHVAYNEMTSALCRTWLDAQPNGYKNIYKFF